LFLCRRVHPPTHKDNTNPCVSRLTSQYVFRRVTGIHTSTHVSRDTHRPHHRTPSPLSVTDRPTTMSGNSAYHWPGVLSSALDAVGCTPLIRLDRIAKEEGLECNLRQYTLCPASSVGRSCADSRIVGKCEFFSVGGSVKDRIAKVGGCGPRRGDPQ
jgi:hypothetical protein